MLKCEQITQSSGPRWDIGWISLNSSLNSPCKMPTDCIASTIQRSKESLIRLLKKITYNSLMILQRRWSTDMQAGLAWGTQKTLIHHHMLLQSTFWWQSVKEKDAIVGLVSRPNVEDLWASRCKRLIQISKPKGKGLLPQRLNFGVQLAGNLVAGLTKVCWMSVGRTSIACNGLHHDCWSWVVWRRRVVDNSSIAADIRRMRGGSAARKCLKGYNMMMQRRNEDNDQDGTWLD